MGNKSSSPDRAKRPKAATAAVYNRFWHSHGGGERHSGMVAQVLAADGHQVDLLSHTPVDVDGLSRHLGLDLSGCQVRVIADDGDDYVADVSAEYDLLVNGSYMSRLAPKSARAAYLCYFPTRFDADLPVLNQQLIAKLGPHVRMPQGTIEHGLGWYPPEGGRRRSWTWSKDSAQLRVPASDRTRQILFQVSGLARGDVEFDISSDSGQTWGPFTARSTFTPVTLDVPAGDDVTLTLRTTTFTPGSGDDRTLGVAVSGLRVAGHRRGPRERLALRYPWLLRDPQNLSFLDNYDVVMANSEYTRSWITKLWNVDSDVLYPPIATDTFAPAAERTPTIVTVGRFFAPGFGHSKRQLEMVEFFGQAWRNGTFAENTRMHLLGGCEPSQEPYLDQVRRAAAGLPVTITANAARAEVERALTTATVFWSATGYGEDESRKPWTSEHFGMTTVEAMAGGCVPVVIDKAGQKEIVRQDIDGFRWGTAEELLGQTARVLDSPELSGRLSAQAQQRAQEYSEAAFADRWRQICSRHDLLT